MRCGLFELAIGRASRGAKTTRMLGKVFHVDLASHLVTGLAVDGVAVIYCRICVRYRDLFYRLAILFFYLYPSRLCRRIQHIRLDHLCIRLVVGLANVSKGDAVLCILVFRSLITALPYIPVCWIL